MKKHQKSKLKLNKFQVAKINYSYKLVGGNEIDDDPNNTATDTKTETDPPVITGIPTQRPTQVPTT